jgi:hypothetical protein
MSIKVASRAWDTSKQSGTRLLTVIALADYANDEGIGWPGMGTLARKCRLQSRRAIQKVCAELKTIGEIYYAPARGTGRSNLFCVVIGLEFDAALKSLKENFKMRDADAGRFLARNFKDIHQTYKMCPEGHASKRTQGGASKRTQGGASKRTQGVRPGGRTEPSLNRNRADTKKTTTTSAVMAVDERRSKYLQDLFEIDTMNAQKLTTLPHVTQSYIDAWTGYKSTNPDVGGGFYYARMRDSITPPTMTASMHARWKREIAARQHGKDEGAYQS